MTRNYPSVEDIVREPEQLRGLDIETVAILLDDLKAREATLKLAKGLLNSEVEDRYGAAIKAAYLAQGKDTGSVHVDADGFDLTADRTKKVEWDQAQLSLIKTQIEGWGEDPSDYLKTTYGVEERAYTGWPSRLRDLFAPARTVKPGSLSFKLARKEAA